MKYLEKKRIEKEILDELMINENNLRDIKHDSLYGKMLLKRMFKNISRTIGTGYYNCTYYLPKDKTSDYRKTFMKSKKYLKMLRRRLSSF